MARPGAVPRPRLIRPAVPDDGARRSGECSACAALRSPLSPAPRLPPRDIAVTYRLAGDREMRIAWLSGEQRMRVDMPEGQGAMIMDLKERRAFL
ncbi:hypothetical protein GCM10010964_37490 [Caldovatus sediminis]|uniref:Uncharacterized protein n=1 Tax=Caldovatus sediminis TaxID=2041189 RepID=A0A8J2ZE06_9PROT|nr:hypothetical protein GCM10010964_37490 [Caldovatus sediminis]